MNTSISPSEIGPHQGIWSGPESTIQTSPDQIRKAVYQLNQPVFIFSYQGLPAASNFGDFQLTASHGSGYPLTAFAMPLQSSQLGSSDFLEWHGVEQPYMAGSMANGISGEEFVTQMGKNGYLASFGAGGLSPSRVLEAIQTIQTHLPSGPYAFNLIHSPNEPALEQQVVDIYLSNQVHTIEASAFLRLTPPLVQFRAAGLSAGPEGKIIIKNKIIAKLSRKEVAAQFLNPAPERILKSLTASGTITKDQARLAASIPMADDITVEADSGGHTDNRPLTSLLPSIIALRNQILEAADHGHPVRIGAAGGIGTPVSVLGAFMMGAEYVVTGSVNQSCLEAGTSARVKSYLAEADSTDVIMAPSADMFEMGVNVQVLKRGSLFPMRAQKLYSVYRKYEALEDLPDPVRTELEEKILQNSLEDVWLECVQFFRERDPDQLERARRNPKKKMALIFRWYLGLATYWGIQGNPDRGLDYQIWCGPSMGAFNNWFHGSDLEDPSNRSAVVIADRLMTGASRLFRLRSLQTQGFNVPQSWFQEKD